MNVEWLVPCRYAEVHDNLATIVGAGINQIWVPEFPTQAGVNFVVSIVGTPDEYKEMHAIKNSICGPDGEILSSMEGEFGFGPEGTGPGLDDGWAHPTLLSAQIAFPVPSPGVYRLDFEVDGNPGKSVALHIKQGPPPGVGEPPA